MKLNANLAKATAVGALGGLLFGFDTAVISGTTHSLTTAYALTPWTLGITVFMALGGTVVGAMFAGIPGQKWGARETLRVLAAFYVLSAVGCAFAWSWEVLLIARFLGGLGIGGSSVLGPVYIAELAPAKMRGRGTICADWRAKIGKPCSGTKNQDCDWEHTALLEARANDETERESCQGNSGWSAGRFVVWV